MQKLFPVLSAISALLCGSASSETFSFTFQGIVTSSGSDFDAFASVGDPVSGTFSYGTTFAEQVTPPPLGAGSEGYVDTPVNITISIGGSLWEVDSTTPDSDMIFGGTGVVLVDQSSVDTLVVSNETSSTSDTFPGYNGFSSVISLAFTDTQAPFDFVNGTDLDQILGSSDSGTGRIANDPGFVSPTDLVFQISSLQAVPEPSSAAGVIIAAGILALRRRRHS